MILLKRDLISILLLSTITSSLLLFKLNVWCYFLSLSQSRSNFHNITPINYTVYRYNQMHQFHYIFNIQCIYVFNLYWYPQSLLVNKFKWVIYSISHKCVYMYIRMCIYIYIHTYVCVCVCFLLNPIQLYSVQTSQFYWYSTVTCDFWVVDFSLFLYLFYFYGYSYRYRPFFWFRNSVSLRCLCMGLLHCFHSVSGWRWLRYMWSTP